MAPRERDESRSSSVLIYDAEADTWEAAPPIPQDPGPCSAATIDGGAGVLCRGYPYGHLGTFVYRSGAWQRLVGGNGLPGTAAVLRSVFLG